METKYAIRSRRNGKYLSMLFEDKHEKMFLADKPEKHKCYFWVNKQTAEEIAAESDGVVEEVAA